MDLCNGYRHVRIVEQDIWKTTVKTKQGLFEWMVMPFGICNALAMFMRVMNDLFRPFLDHFILVYLDDILVHIRKWDEHVCHIKKGLDVLKSEKLYLKS